MINERVCRRQTNMYFYIRLSMKLSALQVELIISSGYDALSSKTGAECCPGQILRQKADPLGLTLIAFGTMGVMTGIF